MRVVAYAFGSRDLDKLDRRMGCAGLGRCVGRACRDLVRVVARAFGSRDLDKLDRRMGCAGLGRCVGRACRDLVTGFAFVPVSSVELVETWCGVVCARSGCGISTSSIAVWVALVSAVASVEPWERKKRAARRT
ncbi:hypothetical protein [Cryobacterium arcticum]|uniref:hypothetical protein n=1 Tax=Cryobacterium arcticum TaxID=670052 RepID=UPI0012ED9E15|nr:hypothetical protein [Cryobacterium arcticum]